MIIYPSRFILNSFLTVVLLSSPCLLITLLFAKLGIDITFGRLLILGILFFVALHSHKNATFIPIQKKVLFYYILMLIYFAISWNVKILYSGSPRFIFRSILVAPMLMIIMNSKRFDMKNFTTFFVLVTFILSCLSIIQLVSYQFNLDLVSLSPASLKWSLKGLYSGMGGFTSPRDYEIGVLGIYHRNMGFFSEPSNFAQFLMVPLFLSMYKYFNKRTELNLIMLLTIALGFFLTFSVANFFGILFGLAIFFSIRIFKRKYNKGSPNSKIIGIFLVVMIVLASYYAFNLTNQFSRDEAIFGKKTIQSISTRAGYYEDIWKRICESPMGDIRFKHSFRGNPGFWGHVAFAGGFPLIFIMLMFLFNLFSSLFKVMIRSKYLLIYTGFFAYFIPVLWDAKFYEYNFLFLTVLYPTYMKYDVAAGKDII